MNERPTCKTCPYWNNFGSTTGHCIVRSPRVFVDRDEDGILREENILPWTPEDFGCGEHPDFPAYVQALRYRAACERGEAVFQ
jgi:hypothetical protein